MHWDEQEIITLPRGLVEASGDWFAISRLGMATLGMHVWAPGIDECHLYLSRVLEKGARYRASAGLQASAVLAASKQKERRQEEREACKAQRHAAREAARAAMPEMAAAPACEESCNSAGSELSD